MKNSIARCAAVVLTVCLWMLPSSVDAAAVSTAITGQPFASVATGKLKSTGVKLLTDAGIDLIAAASGNAYTWDYAWTLTGGVNIKNETTLPFPAGNGGIAVNQTAQSSGWFGRHAQATGTANVNTKTIEMDIKANKFSVAKSVTGVGTTVETAGAKAATVVVTTLANIALDPIFDIPLVDVLGFDGLGIGEPFPIDGQYFAIPAGFSYGLWATGPNGGRANMLSVEGQLMLDAISGELALSVLDSSGVLTCIGAACTDVANGGRFAAITDPDSLKTVGFELLYPTEYYIPWTVPTSWDCTGTPECDPNFVLTSEGGVFARAYDFDVPEPATLPLLLAGILGFAWQRPRARRS